MFNLNKIMLAGNLTRDPETRTTPGGSVICEFGLAVNRKMKDKDETCFVSITVWGKQAEACGKYLTKGANAYIEGRLVYESWEDKSGAKRNSLKVVADNVQFISSRSSGEQQQSSSGSHYAGNGRRPPVSEEYAPPVKGGHRYGPEDCPPLRPPAADDGGELPPF